MSAPPPGALAVDGGCVPRILPLAWPPRLCRSLASTAGDTGVRVEFEFVCALYAVCALRFVFDLNVNRVRVRFVCDLYALHVLFVNYSLHSRLYARCMLFVCALYVLCM